MKQHSLLVSLVAASIAILTHPGLAKASGQIPLIPETKTFTSFQACRSALEEVLAEHQSIVNSRKTARNGDTSEVNLETKGIENNGRESARYEATLWFNYGSYNAELKKTVTSHSYRHSIHECEGATLKTSGEQGYTLATIDPVGHY
jgi:hypothetical protein